MERMGTADRKVMVITYGCQMNVYDSRRMVQSLAQMGYRETDSKEEADLIILNTCSVREKPARKLYSALGRLKKYKARNSDLLLVVAGCVAQQEQTAIARKVPYIDVVLGPDHTGEIGELVELARKTKRQVVATDFVGDPDQVFCNAAPVRPGRVVASVTIIKGCNQFCSYCIVPYTRGREFSRSPDAIVEEVHQLVDSGAREVYLLGQNVNRYGLDRPEYPLFHELLGTVASVDGVERVRFTTSHPADCTDELLGCFGNMDKLQPYFHLPLQSGSDRILSMMNRRYTYGHYRDKAMRLKELCPDCHLSTDLIVGFPGETEEDFQRTLDSVHEVRWGSAFSFKFSPRPGTGAARFADDVPAAVKQERLEKLQELLYHYMHVAMRRHVGRLEEVLVEGKSSRGRGETGLPQLMGRTGSNYIVNFDVEPENANLAGKLVRVRIKEAFTHSLVGELEGAGEVSS